jgi:hypothetical protein
MDDPGQLLFRDSAPVAQRQDAAGQRSPTFVALPVECGIRRRVAEGLVKNLAVDLVAPPP